MNRVKVGVMGCGAIAPAYLKNLTTHFAQVVDVAACADVMTTAAEKCARGHGVPRACTPEDLLADPAIELVVNLTPAPAHHAVNRQILNAGKHLFSEKPLALTREHGREILGLAHARGLRVGGAADTFLGGSMQLARRLFDEGRIGTPVAATMLVSANLFFMERYHRVFRGPLLDLGPYYLTALVTLLGPVVRVSGAGTVRFPRRTPPSGPDAGTAFTIDQASTVSGTLEFADGTVAALVASCDVHDFSRRTEILGTQGVLELGDPNQHGNPVTLRTAQKRETLVQFPGFNELGRGLGVAEMAQALRADRAPRASGELMYHILDVMLAVYDSAASGRHVDIASRVERPEPFDYDSLSAR